jgi:hypothetical protein
VHHAAWDVNHVSRAIATASPPTVHVSPAQAVDGLVESVVAVGAHRAVDGVSNSNSDALPPVVSGSTRKRITSWPIRISPLVAVVVICRSLPELVK